MINSQILKNIDVKASMITTPCFSHDIFELDKTMWSHIRHNGAKSSLIEISDLDALDTIIGATEEEIKQLCSGVILSFTPKLGKKDIDRILCTNIYKLKTPETQYYNLLTNYWLTVKLLATEKGIETTCLIFGMPAEVITTISECRVQELLRISSELRFRFELRYQPSLIRALITNSAQEGMPNIPAVMNRVREILTLPGA